jgi:hypothetical protein
MMSVVRFVHPRPAAAYDSAMAGGGARRAVVGVVAVAAAFVISGVAALAALPPLGWLLLVAGTAMWDSFCGSPVIAWMMVHTPSLESAARVLLAVSISGWIAVSQTDQNSAARCDTERAPRQRRSRLNVR